MDREAWEEDQRLIRKVSGNDDGYQGDPVPDEIVNGEARSWGAAPQRADGVANGGLPCIQVAGVTVWLYRRNGVMEVSVDLDDVNEDTPMVDPDGEGRVPMQITVQGQTVFSADADGEG